MATIFAGYPCADPATFYRECVEKRLPTDWWGKANKFEMPMGVEPGRGFLLMRQKELSQINLNQDNTLVFSGETATSNYPLYKITLIRATCLTPGAKGDPNAAFLLEVADQRFHLARTPVNCAYNVLTPDASAYMAETLAGGLPWTWQKVVNDLATQLGLNTADFVLPFTPDGTPQNLTYWGGSAWTALCDVLTRLACAALPDYTNGLFAFSVVRLGTDDPAADAEVDSLNGSRLWDSYFVDPERMWRPEKVRVFFIRYPRPVDGTSPYYTVDVTLPAAPGVVSGSFEELYDDEAALGQTGIPTNSAALTTRATERANDWLRERSGFSRPFMQVYRDFNPDVPGEALGSEYGKVGMVDDGGLMRTALSSEPDFQLEKWRPLSRLAPWFPPNSLAGDCPGDGKDPWLQIDEAVISGNLVKVMAQVAIYVDKTNKLRLCPYNRTDVNVATWCCEESGGSFAWCCEFDFFNPPHLYLYLCYPLGGCLTDCNFANNTEILLTPQNIGVAPYWTGTATGNNGQVFHLTLTCDYFGASLFHLTYTVTGGPSGTDDGGGGYGFDFSCGECPSIPGVKVMVEANGTTGAILAPCTLPSGYDDPQDPLPDERLYASACMYIATVSGLTCAELAVCAGGPCECPSGESGGSVPESGGSESSGESGSEGSSGGSSCETLECNGECLPLILYADISISCCYDMPSGVLFGDGKGGGSSGDGGSSGGSGDGGSSGGAVPCALVNQNPFSVSWQTNSGEGSEQSEYGFTIDGLSFDDEIAVQAMSLTFTCNDGSLSVLGTVTIQCTDNSTVAVDVSGTGTANPVEVTLTGTIPDGDSTCCPGSTVTITITETPE